MYKVQSIKKLLGDGVGCRTTEVCAKYQILKT